MCSCCQGPQRGSHPLMPHQDPARKRGSHPHMPRWESPPKEVATPSRPIKTLAGKPSKRDSHTHTCPASAPEGKPPKRGSHSQMPRQGPREGKPSEGGKPALMPRQGPTRKASQKRQPLTHATRAPKVPAPQGPCMRGAAAGVEAHRLQAKPAAHDAAACRVGRAACGCTCVGRVRACMHGWARAHVTCLCMCVLVCASVAWASLCASAFACMHINTSGTWVITHAETFKSQEH